MTKILIFVTTVALCILMEGCIAILNSNRIRIQSRQSSGEPDLPSNLPSPPSPSNPSSALGGGSGGDSGGSGSGDGGSGNGGSGGGGNGGSGGGGGPGTGLFARIPALPPVQNTPVSPPVPGAIAPFGLNGVILILVPQFKTRIPNMPKWLHSSLKLEFPITVFFDKMDIPPGSPSFPFGGQFFRNGRFVKRSAPLESEPRKQLNASLHGGDRAMLIPRLEKILKTFGLGKPCLLRAVCEVHEVPLEQRYGLLGQLLTLFFSISRSAFADTHLPEYLEAEESGKLRNCSRYLSHCEQSMFFDHPVKSKKPTRI